VYDFTGNPLATTFAIDERTSPEEASLEMTPAIRDASIEGESTRERSRSLFARSYDLLYGRLELRGKVVGLYSIGLPSDFIFNAGNDTRTTVVLLFGVGMALVLGIGLYLTHQLTKPILRLVRTAKAVASGDLTVRSGVATADEIGVLATSFDEMTAKLQRQHLSTIRALTSAIDARDPYTMGHSVRVGQLGMMLGRELGMRDTLLARLEIGGYLHDIGKIGIPDALLLKPAALTREEFELMKQHTVIGDRLCGELRSLRLVREIVRHHHERLDGSGYPDGLRGDEVSVLAQIVSTADLYDACTSARPYRPALVPEYAFAELRDEASRGLRNPAMVEAFIDLAKSGELGGAA
jgi:response regulator RpfG family c-di-GMP phosphodiesterase